MGQSFPLVVYWRNLRLIQKQKYSKILSQNSLSNNDIDDTQHSNFRININKLAKKLEISN